MYYCKNRYYVPEWCRWLNGDNVGYLNPQDINGLNLFAYCSNNPVMGIDPTGHFVEIGIGIAMGVLALFAMMSTTMAKPVVIASPSKIEEELVSFGDFVSDFITETIENICYQFVYAVDVLDNVMMSKKKGNLKDTGASSNIPSEDDLREAYKNARKNGNQSEANKIILLQKILGYRNKQKRRGNKPKGSKGKSIILAFLLHEIIRRF